MDGHDDGAQTLSPEEPIVIRQRLCQPGSRKERKANAVSLDISSPGPQEPLHRSPLDIKPRSKLSMKPTRKPERWWRGLLIRGRLARDALCLDSRQAFLPNDDELNKDPEPLITVPKLHQQKPTLQYESRSRSTKWQVVQ